MEVREAIVGVMRGMFDGEAPRRTPYGGAQVCVNAAAGAAGEGMGARGEKEDREEGIHDGGRDGEGDVEVVLMD